MDIAADVSATRDNVGEQKMFCLSKGQRQDTPFRLQAFFIISNTAYKNGADSNKLVHG
jgi:hypothetical protein